LFFLLTGPEYRWVLVEFLTLAAAYPDGPCDVGLMCCSLDCPLRCPFFCCPFLAQHAIWILWIPCRSSRSFGPPRQTLQPTISWGVLVGTVGSQCPGRRAFARNW